MMLMGSFQLSISYDSVIFLGLFQWSSTACAGVTTPPAPLTLHSQAPGYGDGVLCFIAKATSTNSFSHIELHKIKYFLQMISEAIYLCTAFARTMTVTSTVSLKH